MDWESGGDQNQTSEEAEDDRKDAQLLLRPMGEDNFPQTWVPSPENRDLRPQLWRGCDRRLCRAIIGTRDRLRRARRANQLVRKRQILGRDIYWWRSQMEQNADEVFALVASSQILAARPTQNDTTPQK